MDDAISTIEQIMTNQQHRQNKKSKRLKRRNSLSLSDFECLEQSNESLCRRILDVNPKQASKVIVDRIKSASDEKRDDLRYVHALNYVNTDNGLDSNIEDVKRSKTEPDDLFTKYGSRCTISMDLDFDKLVLGNDNFNDEFNEELACILNVDPSMVRIESVQKGSVIVIFIVIGVGVVVLPAIAAAGALYQGRKSRTPRLEPLSVSPSPGVSIPVHNGHRVFVNYKDKQYEARVFGTSNDIDRGQLVTVEYIGNTKPFWFQKKETLELNDPRINWGIGEESVSFLIASTASSDELAYGHIDMYKNVKEYESRRSLFDAEGIEASR